MDQFVVPQFIDVEDKIFGPITTRQFLILLGAGLTLFVVYRLADFSLFVVSLVVIGGLALVFAFFKYNGQDFHYFLLNIIQTVRKPSTRMWRKRYDKGELKYLIKTGGAPEVAAVVKKAPARRERIRDLALIVNTGGFYRPEE